MKSTLRQPLVILLLMMLVLGASCQKGSLGSGDQLDGQLTADKSFAEQILLEHNYVRTKPKEYAEKVLKPFMATNNSASFQKYAKSLYEELVTMKPVQSLAFDEPLMRSAQKFAEDHAVSKKIGHVGSNGSTMSQRIRQEADGVFYSYLAESCSYGMGRDARGVMLQLLVDEGIESLGHRRNALNPNLNRLGVGYCDAKGVPYGSATVIDYAQRQ